MRSNSIGSKIKRDINELFHSNTERAVKSNIEHDWQNKIRIQPTLNRLKHRSGNIIDTLIPSKSLIKPLIAPPEKRSKLMSTNNLRNERF